MRIPSLKKLRHASRWLRSRAVDHALILGYHCIADDPSDPYAMCVAPQQFAEQLEILRACAHPISLQHLPQALQDGTLPKRAVVLTFDDGYADNLYAAKPLLERYHIPATVFVTTGYLGGAFWWDELARVVLQSEARPLRLCVMINNHAYEWREDDFHCGCVEASCTCSQHGLIWWLYRLLEPLSLEIKQMVLAQVRTQVGTSGKCQSARRPLTPNELVCLARGNLIDIGAHTVTHSTLTTLSEGAQRYEVEQSKVYLETRLGRPVTGFAYPHGLLSDSIIRLLQRSGFAWACSSRPDVAWRGSDPFQLPRFWVGNWNGTQFAHWLKRWM